MLYIHIHLHIYIYIYYTPKDQFVKHPPSLTAPTIKHQMSFGTIYTISIYPRSLWLPSLAKYLGLDVTFVERDAAKDFREKFPLNRAPTYESPSGFQLTELMAIVEYMVLNSSKPEFLGVTPREKALSTRWFSFANSNLIDSMAQLWFSKTSVQREAAMETIRKDLEYLDSNLTATKYLTGDSILCGDIFTYTVVSKIRELGVDVSGYRHLTRFLDSLKDHPINRKE